MSKFLLYFSLFSFSISAYARDPEFILDADFNEAAKFDVQGYQGINLKIVDEEGNFFCYAPTLEKRPFIQREDFLSDLIAELDKRDLNEAHSRTVSAARFRMPPRGQDPCPRARSRSSL